MICQKCHSPYNEGDKFCQVCGATLEGNNEPKNETVEQTVQAQEPAVPQVQNNYQPPVNNGMNNNMNNNLNNMNGNMNMVNTQPMSNIPQEPKKNNTIVFILIGVIAILLAVVIFLVINNGSKDEKDPDNKVEIKEEKEEDKPTQEVVSSKYSKTEVNGYTFYLPEGYNAGFYESVVFYDDNMYVQGYVSNGSGVISTINKDAVKTNLEQFGITNVTYKDTKANNKNVVVFNGIYNGYALDVVYVEYSKTEYVAAEVYYTNGTNNDATKEVVYDILTKVEVDDSSYSSNANLRVPNLKLEVK